MHLLPGFGDYVGKKFIFNFVLWQKSRSPRSLFKSKEQISGLVWETVFNNIYPNRIMLNRGVLWVDNLEPKSIRLVAGEFVVKVLDHKSTRWHCTWMSVQARIEWALLYSDFEAWWWSYWHVRFVLFHSFIILIAHVYSTVYRMFIIYIQLPPLSPWACSILTQFSTLHVHQLPFSFIGSRLFSFFPTAQRTIYFCSRIFCYILFMCSAI